MKAIASETILCSHSHYFTLCNRLSSFSFSPQPSIPRPHLTRTRTRSIPIPPKTHRFVLKAAESTQPASLSSSSSADKTIVTDDEFSLAKVPFPHAFVFYFLVFAYFEINIIELACVCNCIYIYMLGTKTIRECELRLLL